MAKDVSITLVCFHQSDLFMSLISLTPILSQNQDKRDPRMSSLTTSSSYNRTPAPPENPTPLLSAVPTIPPLFHRLPFPTSMSTRYSDRIPRQVLQPGTVPDQSTDKPRTHRAESAGYIQKKVLIRHVGVRASTTGLIKD